MELFVPTISRAKTDKKIFDRLKILKPKKAYLLFCGNASNDKEGENKDKRNAWRGGEHCADGECNYLHAAKKKPTIKKKTYKTHVLTRPKGRESVATAGSAIRQVARIPYFVPVRGGCAWRGVRVTVTVIHVAPSSAVAPHSSGAM